MSREANVVSGLSRVKLLQIALLTFGASFLLIYPLAYVWPSGWAWHAGAPHDSQYFMMIVGVYATLGVSLMAAARDPLAHSSLIWFTVWSSAVHGLIMVAQSIAQPEYLVHLFTDAGAMVSVALILGVLAPRAKTTK